MRMVVDALGGHFPTYRLIFLIFWGWPNPLFFYFGPEAQKPLSSSRQGSKLRCANNQPFLWNNLGSFQVILGNFCLFAGTLFRQFQVTSSNVVGDVRGMSPRKKYFNKQLGFSVRGDFVFSKGKLGSQIMDNPPQH